MARKATSDVSPVPAGELSEGATVKHYEVIRPLGRGGMGVVYLARDTKLGRLVALKLLLKRGESDVRRLLSEARAIARCRHENIVVVLEVDEHQGTPYMVLEYVDGMTLRASMAQRARVAGPLPTNAAPMRMPPGQAVALMVSVVRALVCAHEQGIVHRDLKPENILLTGAGHVKVVDFGIAAIHHVEGPSEGAPGGPSAGSSIRGTPPYMAPEQWRGESPDPRVDLWAVGVILFELCAGTLPLPVGPLALLAQLIAIEAPMPSLRKHCPEAIPLAAIVDRCLQKRKEARFGSARELLVELEALLADRALLSPDEAASPFLGLSAFQEADAERFFGREADVASLRRMLHSQPLLTLVGASGAGKSSLVRAGVIPTLKKRSGERWEALVLRPGRRPLRALAEVLERVSEAQSAGEGASGPGGRELTALTGTLREEPGALGAALRARCRRQSGRILLFIDQFEELYTLGAEPAERVAFLACLEGAADDLSSPLRALVALRADFLERLAQDRTFLTEATRGLAVLTPPGREGLREALVRPVEAAGGRFESEALVGQMLDALEGTRSPLPLLQFVATKLWEGRDRTQRLLTEASYERLGGVAGALSAHADAVLRGLSSHEQRVCREVLLRLVTPERTRALVGLDELRRLGPGSEAEGGRDAVERVVQRLVEARLLSIETDHEHSSGDRATVELVHESLLESWPQLRRWLDESAQDAQFLARLRSASQQWEASGEAEGLLWREGVALEARAWLERRRAGAGLGEREGRYLRAVVALSERSRRRRQRVVAGLFVALSVIVGTVSFLALRANRDARQARNATRLAVARELLSSDPTTALGLARELEPPEVPRGWADLSRMTLQNRVSRLVITHPDPVYLVAFSPDGKRLASASGDKTVRVWNADGSGEPLVLRGHEGRVYSVAFSPDGRRLVSASEDKTVRVWNADGSGEPLVLRGHEGRVGSAVFSLDGWRLVSASDDKTVRVWKADGSGEPLVLRGHENGVYSVAFSPDGRRFVSASRDKTVRVWNADGSGEPLVLRGHEGWILSAAFSPDGRRLVSASQDKTVRVWNADGAGEPLALRGHESLIYSATFSPDGKRLASASGDKTVRVWQVDGAGEPLILRGHKDTVMSAAFSPDGRRVVSASQDKTVRVWNADGSGEPLVLHGHERGVYWVAFSLDGRRFVSASQDKTVRVWQVDGAGEPLILRGHEGPVLSAAFSPDGRRVVSASQDKTVRVWAADGSGEPLVLRGHENWARLAAFSPDGKRLASASDDKTVRVWSADGSGEPLVLRGHEGTVGSAAFSPDGRRIVSASDDKTVRVWQVDGAGEPLILRGHESMVGSASFSPDGRRLVSASEDKTVRVWNADGSGEPLVLRGHEGEVWSVAFSPDGKRLVSASEDKTVRVWTNLEPLRSPDDAVLWTATRYCLPVERRVELLNVPEVQARADEQTCQRRVEAACGNHGGP